MDDEYSRVMPGRKDVKSVKKPGGGGKSPPTKKTFADEHRRALF
jgi:hypothetical protein